MLSEGDIVDIVEHKDEAGFNKLYWYYGPALYGCIIKITSDATLASVILQKSFIEIYKKIALYDVSECSLFTWMLRVTITQCSETLRCSTYSVACSISGY